MKSSRIYNLPAKFIMGLNYQTVSLTMLAVVAELFAIGLASILFHRSVVFIIMIFCIPGLVYVWKFSESLIAGDFYYQGKENLMIKIKNFNIKWPVPVKISDFDFGNYKPFKVVERLVSKSSLGFDENSVYQVDGTVYDEIFGFDLTKYQKRPGEAFGPFTGDFATKMQALEKGLPEFAMTQNVRKAEVEKSKFIANRRPALVKAGVKKVDYFLFVGLSAKKHKASDKQKILDIMGGFRRLKASEIEAYRSFILAAKTPHSEKAGVLASSEITEEFSEPYHDDYVTGAASLALLPANVDKHFPEVFKTIADMDSCISVRCVKNPLFNGQELFTKFRVSQKKEAGQEEYSEREQMNIAGKSSAEGDLTDIMLDINVLVSGKRDDVQTAIRRLQNYERRGVSSVDQAKFFQLKGYVKEALSGCFPGSRDFIETRTHLIKSVKECSYYGLYPISKGYVHNKSAILLRGDDNSVESIDLSFSVSTPFFAVVGVSGSGKSSLISYIQKVHDQREEIDGVSTLTVSIDVGGSHAWRVDDDPEKVVNVQLKKGKGNNWEPLPVWPLLLLMYDSGKSDGDIENARNFICSILSIDVKDQERGSDVEIITDSVRVLAASGKDLRLCNYVKIAEARSKVTIEKLSKGNVRDQLELRWLNYISYLKRFAHGGEFGPVFDHDKSGSFDVDKVRFWYFNIQSADKNSPDLLNVFLNLAYICSFSLGARFNPLSEVIEQDKKKQILLILEEANWQQENLKKTSVTDLPDQCRKFGIIPGIVVQQFEYLKSLDERIVKGLGRFFYYRRPSDDRDLASDLVGLMGSDEGVTELKRIGQSIEEDYADHDIYSVGYVDEARRVKRYSVDLEDEFLWEITTREGGSDLRKLCIEKGYSGKEAALLLAEHGPKKIPREKMSKEFYEEVLKKIKEEVGEWPTKRKKTK